MALKIPFYGLSWEPSTYWVANPWPPARGGRA
jgi:hypothetical protein